MTNGSNDKQFLSAQRIGLILLIIIGGFFLWAEHKAHIMGALPYLVLLLCPLMHFFMHRDHGGHSKQSGNRADHEHGKGSGQ